MSGEESLIALLAAAPALSALNAFTLNAADENTAAPYCVVSAEHQITRTLDGSITSDYTTLTVAIWAPSAMQAEALADAVASVIDGDPATFDIIDRATGFDVATGMNVATLSVDGWF